VTRVSSVLPLFYVLHFGLCLACFLWIFCDSRFEAAIGWWSYRPGTDQLQSISEMGDWQSLRFRCWFSALTAGGLLGSLLLIVSTFLFGSTKGRSLRSWAAFSLLFGLWLTLFLNWEQIAWAGKIYRINGLLDNLETVAEDLGNHWPKKDGVNKNAVKSFFRSEPVNCIRLYPEDIEQYYVKLQEIRKRRDESDARRAAKAAGVETETNTATSEINSTEAVEEEQPSQENSPFNPVYYVGILLGIGIILWLVWKPKGR